MRVRRIILPIGLFFLSVVVPISPALGAVDASVQFLEAPAAGSVLKGSHKVVAEANAASSLKSFAVKIEPLEEGHKIEPGGAVVYSYAPGTTTAQIEIDWDTTKLTRFNGNYRLIATATSQVDEATAYVQQLKVDNPPQTPTGLVAKNSSGVPTLSWKANPEPDILLYRVLRSVKGGPFSTLAEVREVTFEDKQAPKGAELRYKVLAVRASPVTSGGIASASTSPTPTLFIVPASQAGKSQLDEAPAPEAQVQASAPTIVGPRRDVGYSPYLPYDESALQSPQFANDRQALQGGGSEILRGATEGTAYKPIYTAAGLILFVAALHLLRLALELFRNSGSTSSQPILVSK